MKTYQYYFLDFDGTMFDTKQSLIPVYRYGFKAVGINDISEEECEVFMHHNLIQTAEMRNLTKEQIAPFFKAIGKALDMEESTSLIKPFPETMEFLTKMHQAGRRMGIVSGNSEEHIANLLKKFNVSIFFDNIVGCYSYKKGKPDPDPLFVGCKMIGLPPSHDIVYIGDSLQDEVCATAAGLDSLIVDRENRYANEKISRIKSLLEIIE